MGNYIFYSVCTKKTHGIIARLLLGKEAANTHPYQRKIVFSMESMQSSYLKYNRRYGQSVLGRK
jgi:hypothetical protein